MTAYGLTHYQTLRQEINFIITIFNDELIEIFINLNLLV